MTQVEPPGVEAVADSDFRQQFAALCFSVTSGKTRVLLITSRGTGRWTSTRSRSGCCSSGSRLILRRSRPVPSRRSVDESS